MRDHLKQLTQKTGLAPGTLLHLGDEFQSPVKLDLICYDSKSAEIRSIDIAQSIPILEDKINWVDLKGLYDIKTIQFIGNQFGLHELTLEDILNTRQLPKAEDHFRYFFIVIKLISFQEDQIKLEHVAILLSSKWVLSCQENPDSDVFKVIKDRIVDKVGKVSQRGTDYLVYELLDYVIDSYFQLLQDIDQRISLLNDQVSVETPSQAILKDIQNLKKQVLLLKRYFWYTKDIVLSLKKMESNLITPKMGKYLTDLFDHIEHILDISESFREELLDLRERHLSSITIRSNDIVKMLTIVSVIFMPLTFLAGLYGMNFKFMPELNQRFAYPVLLLLMAIVTIVQLGLFKRKKWFE